MTPVDLGLQYGFVVKCCADKCEPSCKCRGKGFLSIDSKKLHTLDDSAREHLFAMFMQGDKCLAYLSMGAVISISKVVFDQYMLAELTTVLQHYRPEPHGVLS